MIKPLKEFPLMARYKEVFPDINTHTVIAWKGNIYSNSALPDHLIVHEELHLKQQEEMGVDLWVEKYLTDMNFRFKMELDAYRAQVQSVKDRERKNKVRVASAELLSSSLYGNLISKQEAFNLLK